MNKAPHPLDLLVRNLELRAPLSEADRAEVLGLRFTPRTLEHAAYILREGDAPRHCAVLTSGYAFRQKLTGDGARQIISLHIPGDALDFQNLFLDVADHSVQMLTRGEVAVIAREDILELFHSRPAVAHAIVVKILVEGSIFREWVLNIGRRRARERLAHVLCEIGFRLDALGLAAMDGYELPMTQEELGDALGLTPVHVNRMLKALEAEGLITRNKRKVSSPDWNRLREAGDFNVRYLHMEQQKSAAV